MVENAPTTDLPPEIRTRRAALLGHLRAYIDAGQYPVNDRHHFQTPIFIDRHGNRCAVAALLEATGEAKLAQTVAATNNLARVRELAPLPAFAAWLDHHGLSACEAARIQPAYHAQMETDWQPTASAMMGVHAGLTETIGAEAALLAGVRAGIRRNVEGNDDDGASAFGSTALVVEYARAAILPNRGGAHRLALVFQWEPTWNARDTQWYVLGGPLASIDPDDRPGTAFGGELGIGFSFRRRKLPLLAELVTQGLVRDGFTSVRLGAQLGVVW